MNQLTTTEVRLVEQYLRVLDLVSRCAQAVDGDDWWYLLDKARQLEIWLIWTGSPARVQAR